MKIITQRFLYSVERNRCFTGIFDVFWISTIKRHESNLANPTSPFLIIRKKKSD